MYGPIEVLGSAILLYNYTLGDNERLERVLSIWDKTNHKFKSLAYYYDKDNKILYVPKGIDLYYIINSLNRNQLIQQPCDPFDSIGRIMLKYPPRDERQMEAVKFCCGIDQYYRNRNLSQLSINISTGGGKSFIACFFCAFYAVKSIVITGGSDWLQQWKARILEYSDLVEDEIYIISGSSSIQKLYKKIIDPNKIRFYLCTHSTISTYGNKHGWQAIRELFIYLKIGIKIYDEAHLYFENILKIDMFTNTFKTLYLTATPQRSQFHQNKIYQLCFNTIPKIELFDENLDVHTSYLSICFNSHPSAFDIESCNNVQYGFSPLAYVDYFIRTDVYFKLLVIVLNHCLNNMKPDEKVLIYIGTNAAVLQTYYWLRYYYNNISVGIYTSLIEKKVRRSQLDNTIILSTSKSAGVLLDIPNLKYTVVFAEVFHSEVIARQILGRTRNNNTTLIELVDCGFEKLRDWYRYKVKTVYTKYATDISEILFSQTEINQAALGIARREQEFRDMNKHKLKQIVDREPR